MSAATSPRRIVFYAQHLSGVGHFVRTLEIAKALSKQHQVWMFDGGRPVPRSDTGQVNFFGLPRIHRHAGKLAPIDPGLAIESVMAMRQSAIAEALRQIRPHAVVVEHYPFSKWELDEEIHAMLQCARDTNPKAKAVCSIRDIPLQTRHEVCSSEAYVEDVLRRLHAQFDGLMVHADPSLAQLDQYFAGAQRIQLPVIHTGLVAELPQLSIPAPLQKGKWVIASAGGGEDAETLLACVQAAWQQLKQAGELPDHQLAIFGGLNAASDSSADAELNPTINWLSFSTDYLAWMQACDLSISCAGYNTCANILRSGCRAILAPNHQMSDQLERTKTMQGLGYEAFVEMRPDVHTMAAAILRSLEQPAPQHAINLEGAQRSAEFIAELTT